MSEIELKLVAGRAAASDLDALPALKSKARSAALVSRYFDTPRHELRAKGWSLRIRSVDGGLTQTLKTPKASLIERGEWESPLSKAAAEIDFAALAGTPAADLEPSIRTALGEVFCVDVERSIRLIERDGAQIETAVDEGVIRADGVAPQPVREVELELKRGDRAALFALARDLVHEGKLSLSLVAKAERGYRLAAGKAGEAAKASSPRLDDADSVAAAFEAICFACLHDFTLNAELLAQRSSLRADEAIHQGRIALRRLRAAMALFKPLLRDDPSFDAMTAGAKGMASLYGEARDRDVMQAAIAQAAAQSGTESGPNPFAAWLDRERLALHDALVEALEAESWRLFLIDFCAWIVDGPWRRTARARSGKMAKFIRKRLAKRRKALLRQGAFLESLDAEQRHEVRIDAKTLRYMADFFIDAPDIAATSALKEFLKRLEEIQTALGEMHDEEARLDAMAADIERWRKDSQESDGVAIAAAQRLFVPSEESERRLARASKAMRKLAKTDPF